MSLKQEKDDQLQQYLNNLLDEMPLIEPSSSFTDRVMQTIHAQSSSRNETRKRWNHDIVNGCLAAAATMLFMYSGIVNKIMNIDSEIVQLSAYIEKLTQLLNS